MNNVYRDKLKKKNRQQWIGEGSSRDEIWFPTTWQQRSRALKNRSFKWNLIDKIPEWSIQLERRCGKYQTTYSVGLCSGKNKHHVMVSICQKAKQTWVSQQLFPVGSALWGGLLGGTERKGRAQLRRSWDKNADQENSGVKNIQSSLA